MGYYLEGNNANEIYGKLYDDLENNADFIVNGRNGMTKEKIHTVFTLNNPRQRWASWRKPEISPALAFAELILILNGNGNAEVINKWNPLLPKYQGDYVEYPGAYGKRLRCEFGFDQLNRAYETLLYNETSRQGVLNIWNPDKDLPKIKGQPNNDDIPCNICSMIKIRNGKLFWTQIMRSNDLFLGLPYDILQFTALQEIFAGWLNLEIGEYMHISDSLHYYLKNQMVVLKEENLYQNTDDLRLEKKVSEEVFQELFMRLKELGNAENPRDLIKEILNHEHLPEAYNNILMILCLYVIRKKSSDVNLKEKCVEKCTNPLFVNIWNAWEAKHCKKSLG